MPRFAALTAWFARAAPPARYAEARLDGGFGWSAVRDSRFYLGRAGLWLAIVAGHLLILWLVLVLTGYTGGPPPRAKSLTMIDISDTDKPDAPARPAERVQVSKAPPRIALRTALTFEMPPAAAGSGTGHGCGMAAALVKGISENPAAMAAVAALPVSVRSDADAVMLWNGSWLDTGSADVLSAVPVLPDLTGLDPVTTLKTVILATLDTVPPECRGVESIGPQFLPIAEPGRTTMLVIGSGRWQWSSLSEPPVDPSASPAADQPGMPLGLAAALTGN